MQKSKFFPRWQQNVALFIGICWLLAACGGGGSAPAVVDEPVATIPPPEEQSKLFVGLTDAPGDFVQYQVDVVAITLVRTSGVEVETLPLATEFDFAQYTAVTEFFTAASVPVGSYQSASLTLDYSNSAIQVENADGEAVDAVAIGADGEPLEQVKIQVLFGDQEGFRVRPGVPAHITLDFDLESSHKVVLDADPATVQMDGVLLADTFLEHPKSRRARGLLENVDVDAGQFDLQLRPFFRPDGRFGVLPVTVDADTHYEIDGVMYTGTDGLDAMDALESNVPVVTSGILDVEARLYTADLVLAGSSVPFGQLDVITGTVLAREGEMLTLRGAILVDTNYQVRRVPRLQVLVSDSNTTVTQVHSSFDDYQVADIGIGQRLSITGELSASTPPLLFDATEGNVRLMFTDIYAAVVNTGPLSADVANINNIDIDSFNFSGAITPVDPNAYQIETFELPLSGIAHNDAIKVRGMVAPLSTTNANFPAQSIGDVSVLPGGARVIWAEPDNGAVLGSDDGALMLDISGSAGAAHRYANGIVVPLDRDVPWTIVPANSGRGMYALITQDSRQVFTRFDEFSDALLAQIGADQSISKIRTHNIFDAQTQTSEARRLIVFLTE